VRITELATLRLPVSRVVGGWRAESPAFGADTEEFNTMAEDLVAGLPADLSEFDMFSRDAVYVGNAAALDATDVIMPVEVAVKARLGVSADQFANQAGAGQDLQVAVDGSQADVWELLPELFVELRCRRVRLEALEDLKDRFSLPGMSLGQHLESLSKQ
jgi:hypothetical protein